MAEEAAPVAPEAPAADPTPEADASSGKTFSQAELDAIVQDRLARERKKAPPADELKALRAAKAKLDEIETAGASELEKANTAREAAEAKAEAALKTANERLLKSAVITEAAKLGIEKTDLVFKLLDHDTLTVDDDGEVGGVEDAVKAFATEYPEFVGKGTSAGGADQGARGGGPNQITLEELGSMHPAEVTKALREGKLDHLTGNK